MIDEVVSSNLPYTGVFFTDGIYDSHFSINQDG